MKNILTEYLESMPENFSAKGVTKSSDFVRNFLKENKISFTEVNGNIFSLKDNNLPVLSSHMDSVGKVWPAETGHITTSKQEFFSCYDVDGNFYPANTETKIYSKHKINIGADDRAGGALIMEMLKVNPEINFIFSRQEETSPHSVQEVIDWGGNKELLEKLPYCLVLDRKNAGDIIGGNGKYCESDLIKAIEELPFGYRSANGSICDADQLSNYIPCVNLSVGYYKAHTESEYIIFEDWLNCFTLIKTMVEKNFKRFKLKEIKPVQVVDYPTYRYGYGKSSKVTSVTVDNNGTKRKFFSDVLLEQFMASNLKAKIVSADLSKVGTKSVNWFSYDEALTTDGIYCIDLLNFTYDFIDYGYAL